MFKLEKRIIDYLKKNYILVFIIIISILALLVRITPIKFQSDDYIYFLSPWFKDLLAKGGLAGLGSYIGNYNAPYMTIMALLTYLPINSLFTIKAVSIIFDFVLAISASHLVTLLVKNNKKIYSLITYTLVLFLPQIILNSAMWGQCDSIYASFSIIALIFLLKEKYWQSFVFLGISFAFKLQFIFILPVFIIIYACKNKFSILNFLIIPAVNFIMCLPAIIMGKPIIDLLKVYFNQTSISTALVRNYPNIYNFLNGDIVAFKYIGIIMTIVIFALMLFYFIYKKVNWNKDKIITLSLLVLVIISYILPGMHERYLYVGEVLSIVYYLVYRKNLPLVIIINLNAIITYSMYLTYYTTNHMPVLSIAYGIIVIYFARDALKYIVDSKELKNE